MSAFYKTPTSRSITGLRTFSKRTAGFIQGVILFGIALLAVVIAAFAFSNRGSNLSTTVEEAKTIASSIMTHGNSIRTAADRFRADRGNLSEMTFSSTDGNGLFNSTDNFIRPLTVNNKAYMAGKNPSAIAQTEANATTKNGYFFLKKPAIIGGVSSNITTTTGLTEQVCRRINFNLYGNTAPVAVPKVTDGSTASFQGAAGAATIPGTLFPGVQALEEGCIQSTDNDYVYFKSLGRTGE